MRHIVHIALALSLFCLAACGEEATEEDVLGTTIEFEPNRPSSSQDDSEVDDYSGDNEHVQEAQERFRTGLDLHRKVIYRTCSPNGGVCHNSSEYPDLQTPANFFDTIGAPCNVQPGEWQSVYDRCERPGDRFALTGQDMREIEIGWIEYVGGEEIDYRDEEETPEADSPGLHIYLHDPVPVEREEVYSTGQFIRTFIDDDGTVQDLAFANFRTRWWILDDGSHIMAEVRDYQVDQVNELMSVGIVQGDLNRNGEYGARDSRPVSLLEPQNPEESYLIGRLRGTMQGEEIPGSRMPLANQPLSISEMLALYCFVEGLSDSDNPPEGSAPIDYENCSYSQAPEELNLLGDGVTWSGRVSQILEANCGGCHGGTSPAEGLDLVGDDAYDTLLEASTQVPDLKLVEPGEPDQSYLWLKLNGDDSIVGSQMPIDPLEGERTLTQPELDDINTWIVNGAMDE
jgi:hypothetical protein